MRAFVVLAFATLLLSWSAPAWAQAQQEAGQQRARVDVLRAEVQTIETAVGTREVSDDALQRLRQRLDPALNELRTLSEDATGRFDQAKARLDQLGPKPEANAAPESAEVAAERQARQKALTEADEAAKLSRALLLQAEQLVASIADKRRALFAQMLFQRGPGLFSLEMWGSLLASLPRDLAVLRFLVDDTLAVLGQRLRDGTISLVALALLAGGALYWVRARYVGAIMARVAGDGETTRLKRLLSAVVRLAAGALPAALGSWLVYSALINTGALPRRLEPFAWAVLGGVAFVAFMGALADATLAPKWPARRIFGVADRNARILKRMVTRAATVLASSKAVEALLQGISAGLSLSIVVRMSFALLFAWVVARSLNQLRDTQAEEEANACLGPYVPVDGALLAPFRLVGWTLVILIATAAVFGYVAFASFLIEQAAWALIVVTLAVMILMLVDEGSQALLTGEGKVAMALQTNVGLRKRALEQASVLSAGLFKLIILIVGAMLLLAPWGVESGDFASSLRAAFFGFRVGDVTISLSSIIIAGVLFALGLTATRALQGWLDDKLLPATDLDTGLRNSLKTMAGYVGFVAAAALAISSLGLSLERLTIVAGALSVGIGFGLQSIVSNFVSGLILLWERPIRVGDLIVVGDGEGIVKRINVRSTEIETFDRATVIVPNSNLISGVVRNRVRTDRTGRVIVSLSVPRTASPEAVRDVMLMCAQLHPDVQREPPPRVLFKKIGESTLEFDLICVVPEVDIAGRVQSDLHFAIYENFARDGIGQPEREVSVKGLDRIEDTLEELVDTIEEAQDAQAQAAAQRRQKAEAARTARRAGKGDADPAIRSDKP